MSWNADGLRNRVDELREFVNDNPVDLIMIQELKCVLFRGIKIPNYNLIATPRKDNAGNDMRYGGTAIYVKRNLKYCHIPSLPLSSIDNTIIKLSLPSYSTPIYFVCTYVRATLSANLIPDLDNLFSLGDNVVLAGDLNAHHATWNPPSYNFNCHIGIKINNYCNNNLIDIAAPSSPTRFGTNCLASTIDLALLKNINLPYNIEVFDALSSDHLPICLNIIHNYTLPALTSPSHTNWNQFYKLMNNTPAPFTEIDNPNE